MVLLGPFHSLLGGLVADHRLARSFAVAMDEFLVQQKIMIGFLHECFAMTSGSLYDSVSAS